jgi:hypothetical protein
MHSLALSTRLSATRAPCASSNGCGMAELWERFINLFGGLEHTHAIGAYGTGKGAWVKEPLDPEAVKAHLRGDGPGIGIPPLRPDNNVLFAAIDLDEPDFDAARAMQGFLPGTTWLERSRSGNAHIWVFFKEPVEAWIAMGILREAVTAGGKEHVEVFPKNYDFSRVQFGNYINLPYHGDERRMLYPQPVDVEAFVKQAELTRQDPNDWRKRANWLMLSPPGERESTSEFGKQRELHMCAEHIIANAEENPVVEGHRSAVFFALARQLANYEHFDAEEEMMMMKHVNDASPDPIPLSELRRIWRNAHTGQWTSTGCDDPLVLPYTDPRCPIAHPRR